MFGEGTDMTGRCVYVQVHFDKNQVVDENVCKHEKN